VQRGWAWKMHDQHDVCEAVYRAGTGYVRISIVNAGAVASYIVQRAFS
jgi:hypothetical protein